MYATRQLTPTLSIAEQRDLELIIQSARDSGWLDEECSISVVPMDHRLAITSTAGGQVHTQVYEWNSRWLYQFLHDLAHGQWKTLQ